MEKAKQTAGLRSNAVLRSIWFISLIVSLFNPQYYTSYKVIPLYLESETINVMNEVEV